MQADVGLAMGGGTDIAIDSADIVILSNRLDAVLAAHEISRRSYRKMLQNLVWATGYNLAAIPIAAGALAFAGITIPPALAAIAMSFG